MHSTQAREKLCGIFKPGVRYRPTRSVLLSTGISTLELQRIGFCISSGCRRRAPEKMRRAVPICTAGPSIVRARHGGRQRSQTD